MFYHTILLEGIHTQTMTDNAIWLKVRTKCGVEKISCIISFEYSDGYLKLVLDHGMEILEDLGSFGFVFHQKGPTQPSVIMY